MPRPVSGFVEDNDVQTLIRRQNDIIQLYRYDIAKYADGNKKLAIREIFDEMPSQLDSQTKRFNFSAIAPRGTYERYKDDFIWLVDAGLPFRCGMYLSRSGRFVLRRTEVFSSFS